MIAMDVDAALAEVPVNIVPLTDSTDFVSIEEAVAFDAAGMELIWHFVTSAGAYSATVVTPTAAGVYDWAHQDGGMYTIEIPASGGASINNNTAGYGWFTGKATGVLPWRGPTICFRAAALNDALVDNAWSTTRGLAGTALPNAAADAAGGLPISDAGGLDLDAKLANTNEVTAARMGALTDWIDGGRLDLLVDAVKTKTDFLPSATAGSAGGVFIAGSNAATTFATLTVSGATTLTGVVTADHVSNDIRVKGDSGLSLALGSAVQDLNDFVQTDVVNRIGGPSNLGSGATLAANLVDIESQTDDIQSRLPAALLNGKMQSTDACASGTADSGTISDLVDTERTESPDDYWVGMHIKFTSGSNVGLTRLINGFNSGTDQISWTPDLPAAVAAGVTYEILPNGRVDLAMIRGTQVASYTFGGSAFIGANVEGISNDFFVAASLESMLDGTAGQTLTANITGNITGNLVGTVSTLTTYTGNTPQTGDSFARLGAPAGASISVDIAAVKTDTGNLVTRITSTLFSGITSLAQWLGLIAGKQTGDSTARTELRATGAGSGAYLETSDSLEALRDRGDAAWNTATGFSTHSAADVWAAATRTLTAGTNIVLAKGTGITGFNDISTADVTASVPTAIENADALLIRSVSNVEATAGEHTLCTVILASLESSRSGTTWTIKRTNGSTTHATKTLTVDAAADPVVGVT